MTRLTELSPAVLDEIRSELMIAMNALDRLTQANPDGKANLYEATRAIERMAAVIARAEHDSQGTRGTRGAAPTPDPGEGSVREWIRKYRDKNGQRRPNIPFGESLALAREIIDAPERRSR